MSNSPPSPEVAPPASGGTLICPVCELSGGPFSPEEAAYLIGIHRDLHHGISSAVAGGTDGHVAA